MEWNVRTHTPLRKQQGEMPTLKRCAPCACALAAGERRNAASRQAAACSMDQPPAPTHLSSSGMPAWTRRSFISWAACGCDAGQYGTRSEAVAWLLESESERMQAQLPRWRKAAATGLIWVEHGDSSQWNGQTAKHSASQHTLMVNVMA